MVVGLVWGNSICSILFKHIFMSWISCESQLFSLSLYIYLCVCEFVSEWVKFTKHIPTYRQAHKLTQRAVSFLLCLKNNSLFIALPHRPNCKFDRVFFSHFFFFVVVIDYSFNHHSSIVNLLSLVVIFDFFFLVLKLLINHNLTWIFFG